MQDFIPTLYLWDYLSSDSTRRERFLSEASKALRTKGFFFLGFHGIANRLLVNAQALFTEFFDLPREVRLRYEDEANDHQRGYTPIRTERGEFSKNIPDEKHFFQYGVDGNPSVVEIAGFDEMCANLFSSFTSTYTILMQAVAETLELPKDHFDQRIGNSIFRAIDYPATSNPLSDDGPVKRGANFVGQCATKHTDINFLTILDAKEPGLQLSMDRGETWTPVTVPDPSLVIVNCGDMLEHYTNGLYVSGLHRVICQKDTRRFSIPFFGHLDAHWSIEPLSHLGSPNPRFRFKTAGEFLDFRLDQIGLKAKPVG